MKQSKKTARPTKAEPAKKTNPPAFYMRFSKKQQEWMVVAFFVVVVILLHSPLFFNQRLFDGGDSHEALVKTNMINAYYDQTGEVPRWNPYPEAGIPNVFFLPKPAYSPDFYLDKLGNIIGISIVYLLIGVLGMYYLLRYLRFNLLISVFVALTFIIAPYYRSLIIVGQYMPTKFEAAMLIPWVVLTFLLFLDRMKWLYALLFSLSLAIQLMTQHYQVIFYTGLLVFAIGFYPLLKELITKQYKSFLIKTGTLLAAAAFALVLVAYPLFVSKKFNDASLRATWGIDLNKPASEVQKGSGVAIDFIDQWSPATRELSDLIIPAASGGTNKEFYKGTEAPELSGNELPAYWGKMTFSFSYIYFGLAVLLALVGIAFNYRNKFVLSISIAGLLFTIWSLGTTFQGFYLFFYDYLPFFKNFRTPPTSLTVVFFIVSILSAYGLKSLFAGNNEAKLSSKQTWLTIGGFFAIGLFFYLIGEGFNFSKTNENYEANYLSLLTKARSELYFKDLGRYFILVLLLSAIALGFHFRKISQNIALGLVGILMVTDLTLINARYRNELLTGEEVQARYFPAKPITDFFKTDMETYRVFPVTDRGRDLSAVVPIIGDHDLQVLTTVYELNTNNLYKNIDSLTNINWNVLKIFGVKYFVADRDFYHPQLTLKFSDPQSRDYVYQFNGFKGFGHFVEGFTVIPKGYDRLSMINNASFDPSKTVLVEKNVTEPVTAPDSSNSKVTLFTPNEVNFEVYTNKQALFIIPIPFVKDGWTISIDNKEVKEVYSANHAVQSVVVPAGNHKITATFNKASYTQSYWISLIAFLVLYGLLIYFILKERKILKDKATVLEQ